MKKKSIAQAYSRSLFELGEQEGIDITGEFTSFTELINCSNDLENLLFLEVFTIQEKQSVLEEVFKKMGVSTLFQNFFSFLCQEKRLGLLPLIFKELVVFDDDNKGFIKGVVEGSDEDINREEKEKLTTYMEKHLSKKVQLDYKRNSHVTAGYRLSVEDLQLDVTIDNQLEGFKKTILQGETL